MRYIYTLVFFLLLPFIFLRLWWKARKNSAYAQKWQERLGIIETAVTPDGIWLHAVSVGESLAAISLIKALLKYYPLTSITVTNETPTGAERIRAALGKQVTQLYVPYDVPFAIKNFLGKVKPKLVILMETELWPNILHACQQQHIPILLANARLSARSMQNYQRIGKTIHSMLDKLTMIAAQASADAERFIKLGAEPTKILVTGSIKFDLELPQDLTTKAQLLREQWGINRLIWIAASTHAGEEEQILYAYKKIKLIIPNLLLVLVPRHPERFLSVANYCKKQNYQILLRSENKSCAVTTDIVIGDTMGELLLFFSAADIAFVGGSLIEHGGHNPLEPAAVGLPIIMGPNTFNFAAIVEQLKNSHAMVEVNNSEQLAEKMLALLQDKNKCEQLSKAGLQFIEKNRGALAKHLKIIEQLIT